MLYFAETFLHDITTTIFCAHLKYWLIEIKWCVIMDYSTWRFHKEIQIFSFIFKNEN